MWTVGSGSSFEGSRLFERKSTSVCGSSFGLIEFPYQVFDEGVNSGETVDGGHVL